MSSNTGIKNRPSSSHGVMPSQANVPTAKCRITYFITRNDGSPVPLIPADELPPFVRLQDVPRTLTPEQTYGLQYCGNAASSTGVMFELEGSPGMETRCGTGQTSGAETKTTCSSHDAGKDSDNTPDLSRSASSSRAEMAKSWRQNSASSPARTSSRSVDSKAEHGRTQSLMNTILATGSGAETAARLGYLPSTVPPSGILPDHEKKEYCTYWILHGDCAFMQQGCRYKHEMPSKAKLNEIGIHNVPRWWLERNSPVKFAMGRGVDRNAIEKVVTVGRLRKPEGWLITKNVGDLIDGSPDGRNTTLSAAAQKYGGRISIAESACTSPILPPSRPSTPFGSDDRRESCGSDLIDFPTLPLTTSATTTSATTEPAQQNELPKSILKNSSKGDTGAKTRKAAPKSTKVFVPAGESPEKHVAEVKRREHRQRSRRNASPDAVSTTTSKSGKSSGAKRKQRNRSTDVASSGGASQSDSGEGSGIEKETHQRTKYGGRIRRPVSTSSTRVKA